MLKIILCSHKSKIMLINNKDIFLQKLKYDYKYLFMSPHKILREVDLKELVLESYASNNNDFHLYLNSHAGTFYSQEGEEVLLGRIFGDQSTGFYVDVGAHHPKRYSNTYSFYKRGWRGINIDALPGSMKVFQKLRPRDINLEIAISEKEQILTYYMFNEPALNGFSKTISTKRQTEEYQIVNTIDVSSFSLSKILNEHLQNQNIVYQALSNQGPLEHL